MPGGSKPGGGLKSSPVYKMKGFSGFGNSPVKKVSQKVTEGFNKNQHNYGKTTKVATTMKDGSTTFVEKSQKTGRTVRSGSTSARYSKPKFDPTKTMKPGVAGFEDFQKTIKKTTTSKPNKLSKFKKAGKKLLGKATKFLGGRALGVAGMMMGSMGTADANPANKRKMSMQQERDLVKRTRNMKNK